MIINIGTDIVSLERIGKLYARYPESFLRRLLTEAERAEFAERSNPVSYLAGRWAAKEALGKALTSGMRWGFTGFEVLSSAGGAPCARLLGQAADAAASMGVRSIHISISHEREYAVAVAVLEG